MPTDNLGFILNKRVIAYKRTGDQDLALKFDDNTILEIKLDGEYDSRWLRLTITVPDEDEWISAVAA